VQDGGGGGLEVVDRRVRLADALRDGPAAPCIPLSSGIRKLIIALLQHLIMIPKETDAQRAGACFTSLAGCSHRNSTVPVAAPANIGVNRKKFLGEMR
jgi:hypothetical protein